MAISLLVGVGMTAWAQDTVSAYNFGTQATLSMSGTKNTSNTTGFSVVEPISGSSITSTTNTEVIVGFLGAAGSDSTPPTLSVIGNLGIQENQPIGTRVGEFTATNFESESITFSLVQGEGSADNPHFSLSTDGLLTTRAIFDYEKGVSEFTIRARASSTGEEWAEKVFRISLIDLNEEPSGEVTVTGEFRNGQTLTIASTVTDPDGMNDVQYRWYRDGQEIKNSISHHEGGLDGLNSPVSIVFSPDERHAYVAANANNSISWFVRNLEDGHLAFAGIIKDTDEGVDGLSGAQSVTISADGKHVYVGASDEGSISWFTRNEQSGDLTYGGTIKDTDEGVDGLGYAYSVELSADGNHVYVAAKEDDAISWFTRDKQSGALTFGGLVRDTDDGVDGLNGAIDLEVSADGKHAYIIAQVDSSVSWFARDVASGVLTFVGMIKDSDEGVDGLYAPLKVVLTADGKHVYITAYDNSVSWFTRDELSGALSYGATILDTDEGVDGLEAPNGVTLSADAKHVYVTASVDCSVSWFSREVQSGTLTYGGTIKNSAEGLGGLRNPFSPLATRDGGFVYVLDQLGDKIFWFDRNETSGALSHNQSLADGNGGPSLAWPRGIFISPDGKHIYVPNGRSGLTPNQYSFNIFSRDNINGMASFLDTIHDTDEGGKWVSAITGLDFSADGKHVYVTASNDDSLSWFTRDEQSGALSYGGTIKDTDEGVDGLDSANSVELSSDGKHVYVTAYNDDSLSWFTRDEQSGALTYGGTIKDTDEGVDGLGSPYSIELSSDGKHVYVTASNDGSLSWFTRNEQSGALSYGGKMKDFEYTQYAKYVSISSNGRFVYLLSRHSFGISWYERDEQTGELAITSKQLSYTVGKADEGSEISARISAIDNFGNVQTWISPSYQVYAPPRNLGARTDLNINEFQPAGTVVGQIVELDFPSPNLEFSLSNNEDTPFELAKDGTLRTTRILDFETDQREYLLGVIAQDSYGNTAAANFVITLLELELVEIKDFRLSNHSIVENKPAGTLVGRFEVPDSKGLEHTYSLVQGDGGEGNAIFQLSPEGKLTNRKVFDYERMQRTSVRVRAVNKTRGVLEKTFHLFIEDQPYMPGIETMVDGRRKKGGVYTRYRFGGMVYDKGEISSDLQMGVLISGRPIRKDGLKDTTAVRINHWEGRGIPTDNFRFLGDVWTPDELRVFGGTVYVKAFAQSKDGKVRIYGEQEVIELDKSSDDGLWKGASEIWGAMGWWESSWFGLFYKSESGWVMHEGLGWLYPAPSTGDGIWLWQESMGWMWTNPSLYPFLYMNRSGGWSYFYGEFQGNRLLFDYNSDDWVMIEGKQTNLTENE